MKIKRNILIIFILCFGCKRLFSQNYFEGNRLYCKSSNVEAMKLFNTGIETLHLNSNLNPEYLRMTSNVFYKAYKIDSTFCDAAFFAGYTRRLLNDKNALVLYYIADSLSQNKSKEFKINLAAESLRLGSDKSIELSRKKYNELIQYFPDSPEGYYGFAVTSTIIGDVEMGLKNINFAIDKYYQNGNELNKDVIFLNGILLTLNKKYEEGLDNLEMCYSRYKKDVNFLIHYSLCLFKVSEIRKNDKLKEKSLKFYNKIENKNEIPKELSDLLKF